MGNDKTRFCADPDASRQLLAAVGPLATTLGIPCLYYGTEQGFDGQGDEHLPFGKPCLAGILGLSGATSVIFFMKTTPRFKPSPGF
ncbi:hypothetical protein ACS5NO_03440 [Larkinella sp. GY13]|uniref:hypothetical protein n=1 Tax=Larkinella sp. GY13 TaxID=3453720 RepID=UPI003EEED198